MENKSLRSIPPVDDILSTREISRLRAEHPALPWTHFLRGVIESYRRGKIGPLPTDRDQARSAIVQTLVSRVRELRTAGMRRVINGTGVILHTNLGRAIAGQEVKEAVIEAMSHYVNLELDLGTGNRSHRGEMLSELICLTVEAEAAMVVNNNAAAVYLVVNSFSPPGRVIISRGELVEIGGSFRLPDILSRAAEGVVEVGTTNRTYIEDFAKEARAGDVLMKAHRSNYDIRGFTHDTSVAELVELAREKDCSVVYDLGSGSFFDFTRVGIEGEERVKDVLRSGVDCVTMSGDKLLGGVQAGIIVGRKGFLERLGQNPLRRAVRVDKTTIAALQALFRTYLFGTDPTADIPTLTQSTREVAELRSRAERILGSLFPDGGGAYPAEVVDDMAAIGGGSFACEDIPSVALAFRCPSERDAVSLAKRMRRLDIPILPRIKGAELRINLRSVLETEDNDLCEGLRSVLANPQTI